MLRKLLVPLAVVLLIAAVGIWTAFPRRGSPARQPVVTMRDSGMLTLAAAGSTVLGRALPDKGRDAAFDRVIAWLQGSSLAVIDLEQTLVDRDADQNAPGAKPRWLTGTERTARDLRSVGFSIVTLANDHAADDGGGGLEQTARLLTDAGLPHAGSGPDLSAARLPAILGASPRRVAVIAVTTSASPQARATASRGDIRGRPGVNALKYQAVVTADAMTYAALSQLAAMNGQSAAADGHLEISGTVIKKGATTSVELVADQQDLDEILNEIKTARSTVDVVVVSLHNHEPGNLSDAPAPFVQAFARKAIDAGASLIVGDGPRRLRGVEIYNGGAILYSLGSFAFDKASINPDAANLFDTGINLYDLALNAVQDSTPPKLPAYDEAMWWQSVIAIAGFEDGRLSSLTLEPIDLGHTLPERERGIPRAASGDAAQGILRELVRLSEPYGTKIVITQDGGRVELPPAR